jgi:hypothetical protein
LHFISKKLCGNTMILTTINWRVDLKIKLNIKMF